MPNRRKHPRSQCNTDCLLVSPDGFKQNVIMQNISLGGALLKNLQGGIPDNLKVNKDYSLIVGNESSPATRYACTIIRMNQEHFAVAFLEVS